nr:MAG TPA: hypothetical protein [Caudoviricetes sp.]
MLFRFKGFSPTYLGPTPVVVIFKVIQPMG